MIILVPEFEHSAGSETVLLRVLPRWTEAGHDVVLAAPLYRLRHYVRRGLDPRVRRTELGWANVGWRRWLRWITERTGCNRLRAAGLRDQARREGATHVFLPWVVDQPVVNFGPPAGVMMMDLAWRHYPEGWFGKTAEELDAQLESWLRAADLVFPVSEATADEVRTAFPDYARKLDVVPHGAEWRGGTGGGGSGHAYFLTPASLTPNKDHATLLRAAISLWREGADFRLVWTGPGTDAVAADREARSAEGRALQAIYREHAAVIAGRLDARGFVTDDELDRLYAGARRVVLPSTYEGFGLPVMEAFERGARVICTDIAPFEEQVKRHAMQSRATLVRCGDEAGLATALRSALAANDEPVADEAELRRRVEAWTWDNAARAYAKALEAVR